MLEGLSAASASLTRASTSSGREVRRAMLRTRRERHHHEQRGRDPRARHVPQHGREPSLVETEHVVEVAAHRAGGLQAGEEIGAAGGGDPVEVAGHQPHLISRAMRRLAPRSSLAIAS